MQDDEREIMFGAVHEAGHVVVSMHCGMPVFGFRVTADGLGEVRGGGHPNLDLDKMTDAWLAGPAAEGMFRNQDQCPDLSQVELVLGTIELGDEVDDPDDYHMAVELISRREPD